MASGNRGSIGNIECPGNLAPTLIDSHSLERAGPPGAANGAAAVLDPETCGELCSDQCRLIETTRPQSPAVKRHRDQQRSYRDICEWRDVRCHCRRNPDFAAIFEFHHQRTRHVAIFHCRSSPSDPRRLRQATPADFLIGSFKGQSADGTAAVRKPVHFGPARSAKAVQLADNGSASGAPRRECKVQRVPAAGAKDFRRKRHRPLLRASPLRTSAVVTRQAIGPTRRSAKYDRARRRGGDLFLYRRAFADCIDRFGMIDGPRKPVLIVTVPGLEWTAAASDFPNARLVTLDDLEPDSAEVIVAVGLLEQVDDPALAGLILKHALRPAGHLLGAALGGRSLARLRGALLDAERADGRAVGRFHPMLDGPAVAGLLNEAGFRHVVIDVDRVEVRYRGVDRLIADLRDMGCTSSLANDVPSLSKEVLDRARLNFLGGSHSALETFEILHFSSRSGNAV